MKILRGKICNFEIFTHHNFKTMLFKLILTICLSISLFSTSAQSNEDFYKPSKDSATVIIGRINQLWRKLNNFNISLDGEQLCKLHNNHFFVYRSLPQKKVLSNAQNGIGSHDKRMDLELNLEAGKVYFIECIPCGVISQPMCMQEIKDANIAKQKMLKMKPEECVLKK
jgi:hypothetical protein